MRANVGVFSPMTRASFSGRVALNEAEEGEPRCDSDEGERWCPRGVPLALG